MAVIGLDIGTQSLKAVVLSNDLTLLGSASQPYTYAQPRMGWAEQDPSLWLAALRPAIESALNAAGASPADIAALGVCGQLDAAIATDNSGDALAPALIWMDRRAAAVVAHVDAGLVASRSGLVCDATHMAAKIAWLKQNGFGSAPLFHQPVSFLVARLTGEITISHSLASTTMLYSIAERDWDDALLDTFGVTRHELPPIADESQLAGKLSSRGAELSGLLENTPVAVGTGDDFANPIGCGIVEPGVVAVSLGTAETVSALSQSLVLDPDGLLETHAFPGGHYHLGNPGWLSGGALRWLGQLLAQPDAAALVELAAEAPAGAEGLIFLPALTGAMTPRWNAAARGCFIGLTQAHGRPHMARAVLEGAVFAMRDVVDRLAALGVPTHRLRLMGGGAKSALWCQIRADVTGRIAEVQAQTDASATGAALLAAVAVGLAPSVSTAAAGIGQSLREVSPQPHLAESYEQAYRSYRAACAALDPYWSAVMTH